MANHTNSIELKIKSLEEEQKEIYDKIYNIEEIMYGPFDYDYEEVPNFEYDEDMDRQTPICQEEIDLERLQQKLWYVEEELGELRRSVFLEKILIDIVENSTKVIQSDLLDREKLAESIAKLIINQEDNSNLSIGILGKWGSGKTTFLNMIHTKLEDENTVVAFNASKYDDQEQIWFSLLSAVSKKYLSNGMEVSQKFKFLYKSLKEKKELSAIYIPGILTVIYFLTILLILKFHVDKTLLPLYTVASSGIGYLALKSIKKSYKSLEKYFLSTNEQMLKQLRYPNYRELLGTRENVRTELAVFKNLIVSKKTKLKNLVIMIDELDRCSEKTIKSFFSSIEAFIDIPGIIFIFSFNPDIVYPAINNNLENTPNPNVGIEFIEKYVNLFLTLPSVTSYKRYIESLLNNIISVDDVNNLSKLIDFISNTKDTSPREIKKLLDLSLIYYKEFTRLSYQEFLTILILQYYFSIFDYLESKRFKNTQFLNINSFQLKKLIGGKYPDELFELIISLLPNINVNTITIHSKEINNIIKYIK
ncbi:KAP family P-loop NTPase fold protein [Enterococcus cecorum]|uniref:KAP family P-loop NTPase fold protein n=1 Tax=Enterococcus cecorum TaxID=44008 RepID=UPI00200A94AF|nr:P-loop NTPase fold protein [Enterococcus cecorum]